MIFNKKSKKMKKKLDSILNTTYELVKNSDIKDVRRCPAYSLVRAMTNYHLFDIVRELYEDENVTKVQSIFRDIGEGIFNSRVLKNAECFELGKSNINIDLSKDAILVCAWNKRRFIDALLKIGGNVNNSFEFDKINHMATYIYPIGVTVVYNGNHSIITGILKSEGMIQANETYNLVPTYDYMYFDGVHFRSKENDSILFKVNRFEIGVLYEMGRIFAEYGIT